jgi:uncharacterized protein (DUF1778 family)
LFPNLLKEMGDSPKNPKATARFDTRLTGEQKRLFEQAAHLEGYKSLSEFVIHVVQEAAHEIVTRHNTHLATEKDKEIFFDALLHPPQPAKALTDAVKRYQKKVQGNG